jgi:multidrug resistance efflux pump
MALVPNQKWVIANMKETQMDNVRRAAGALHR